MDGDAEVCVYAFFLWPAMKGDFQISCLMFIFRRDGSFIKVDGKDGWKYLMLIRSFGVFSFH
jgi:hypothetical protein